jgi:Tfp pilus assembly protein PilN
VNDEIDRQQAENAQLQSQIDQLREFQDLQEQAAAKQALLDTAFANEVSFSGMLMDVSRVIPTDAYLTSFSAQLTVAPAGEAETVGAPVAAGFIGEITTAGQAAGVDSLASWLTRLESVRGWVNPWLDAFTETAQNSRLYTFTSGVDLTSDALTRRGRGEAGG